MRWGYLTTPCTGFATSPSPKTCLRFAPATAHRSLASLRNPRDQPAPLVGATTSPRLVTGPRRGAVAAVRVHDPLQCLEMSHSYLCVAFIRHEDAHLRPHQGV